MRRLRDALLLSFTAANAWHLSVTAARYLSSRSKARP